MRMVFGKWEILIRPLRAPIAEIEALYQKQGAPVGRIRVDRDLFEAYRHALHPSQRWYTDNGGLRYRSAEVFPESA